MLELTLNRKHYTETSTIGELRTGATLYCYTLEDTVRAPGVKVPGKTAIPAGRYEIVVDMSTRFGRLMPRLLNVPGFVGVRIHKGNTAADTEGCILVGRYFDTDKIWECEAAFHPLFTDIMKALETGQVFLTIVDTK